MADNPSSTEASGVWSLDDNYNAEAGDNWPEVVVPIADFLVLSGGGGYGVYFTSDYYGGGGGAGGLRTSYGATSGGGASAESSIELTPGTTYTITVGAGGAQETSGNNSQISGTGFTTLTSIGGGKGGAKYDGWDGFDGGCGGGAGSDDGSGVGGSGTANQGYGGGASQGGSGYAAGGGGGTASVGLATVTNSGRGGTGGSALSVSINGSSIYYGAGAGGGQGYYGNNVGIGANGTGWAVVANRGHGGSTANRTGSSGVIILRLPTAQYSGTTTGSPSVSTSGTDTILTYTSSGSYTA